MPKTTNPFVYGGPVDTGKFIGRNAEVTRVFDQLQRGKQGSVSIIGERRIGKTSLMHYVSAPDVIRQWNLDETASINIYQDCGAISPFTITNFWKTILRRLKRELRRKKADSELGEHVERLLGQDEISITDIAFLLNHLHKHGHVLILFLDEFEWCVRTDPVNEAITRGFLGGLRALINHSPRVLSYVLATRQSLFELCRDVRSMGSPFYNNFVFVTLRPFSKEEAAALLQQMLGETGVTFTDDEEALIYDLAGTQPLLLQVAAGLVFDARMSGTTTIDDYSIIRQQFKELVQHQFEDFWKWSKSREREILKSMARNQTDRVAEQLQNWNQERESLITRGLIVRKKDGTYGFLSSAFWEWLIDNLYRLEELRRPRSPELNHLQQQLTDHLRRLRILELQAAQFGKVHAPPHLLIDIEDAQATIASLEEQIAQG